MATIAAGNHVEVYAPLEGDITVTPGTGGYVEFGCSSPSGETAPAGRRVYESEVISVPAGSTMFLRAVSADAEYSDPITSNASSLYATLALTATASGKRQALGSTRAVKFTAAAAGSVYVKFTDASAAIAVSSSDTSVDCNASTAVTLNVPSGYPFIEYLRVGGSDVNFNLGLMV